MKIKSTISALVLSAICFAQTTITKSFNDPVVGDVLSNVVLNGTVNNTPSGTGVTFNNSSVTAGATSSNTYTLPTAADLTSFVGATIKHSDGSGIVVYYKQSNDKLEIVGIDNPAGTLKFTNPGTAIVYPTSYGSTTTDQAQGSLVASGTTAYFKGNITSHADATGTLIIGTKTFNDVLRLKITQNYNIYLDATMLFSVGTATNTTYMYFDATHKFPLLNFAEATINVPVASINQTTSGAQAQNFIFLGTNDVDLENKMVVYPNPFKDVLFIKGNENDKMEGTFYSIDGRKVQTVNFENGKAETSSLNNGNYILELKSKLGNISRHKIIKN